MPHQQPDTPCSSGLRVLVGFSPLAYLLATSKAIWFSVQVAQHRPCFAAMPVNVYSGCSMEQLPHSERYQIWTTPYVIHKHCNQATGSQINPGIRMDRGYMGVALVTAAEAPPRLCWCLQQAWGCFVAAPGRPQDLPDAYGHVTLDALGVPGPSGHTAESGAFALQDDIAHHCAQPVRRQRGDTPTSTREAT